MRPDATACLPGRLAFARLGRVKALGGVFLLGLIVVMASGLFAAFSATIAPGLVATVAVGGPVAVAMACALVFVLLRSALSPERRSSGWARRITSPNAKVLFGALIIVWAIAMASLNLLPRQFDGTPNTAEGGLALLGLIGGVLIFLGFIWAVIGE